MKMSMTKARRTALAAEVVAGITACIKKTSFYFSNTTTPLFNNAPGAVLPGDGTFTFHLPERGLAQTVSSHEQLAAAKLLRDLKETFAPAAAALGELLPGQHLTWKRSAQGDRHQLLIGESHGRQSALIDTVLARWKAPWYASQPTSMALIPETGRSAPTTFIFAPNRVMAVISSYHSPSVDARSIDEAFRLSAFEAQTGAAASPRDCANRFATVLGDILDHDDYITQLQDRMIARQHA